MNRPVESAGQRRSSEGENPADCSSDTLRLPDPAGASTSRSAASRAARYVARVWWWCCLSTSAFSASAALRSASSAAAAAVSASRSATVTAAAARFFRIRATSMVDSCSRPSWATTPSLSAISESWSTNSSRESRPSWFVSNSASIAGSGRTSLVIGSAGAARVAGIAGGPARSRRSRRRRPRQQSLQHEKGATRGIRAGNARSAGDRGGEKLVLPGDERRRDSKGAEDGDDADKQAKGLG